MLVNSGALYSKNLQPEVNNITQCLVDEKLSYRRGTARCVVSVEILPIATQQCSTTSPEQIEVMKLDG